MKMNMNMGIDIIYSITKKNRLSDGSKREKSMKKIYQKISCCFFDGSIILKFCEQSVIEK